MLNQRRLSVLFSILLIACLGASHNKDLQALLDSETAFMQMAKDRNTRDAFLFYLSDDAITAEPGKGPRKGKSHLESNKPNDSWLYWYPSLSEIAGSGDFGYNTGPWEFRRKREDAEPAAFGQFVSIWKKQNDGQWKVALDMGINHTKPATAHELRTSVLKGDKSRLSEQQLINLEHSFIQTLYEKGKHAYDQQLATYPRLLRPGLEPLVERLQILDFIKKAGHVEYSIQGHGLARSGDLGYIYGKATVTPPGGDQKVHSYVRIWKKESGGWRIAVDLLSD